MQRPYVAICVPPTGMWKPKMGQALVHLACRSLEVADTSVLIEDQSGVADARNRLVLGAFAAGASHVLFVDIDMTFPDDALVSLLAHGKHIVGASARRRAPPYQKLGKWSNEVDPAYPSLRQAELIGTGFLLIACPVFDCIAPPWFFDTYDWAARCPENLAGRVSEDTNFIRMARAAGIDAFVDLKVTAGVKHIGETEIGWSTP